MISVESKNCNEIDILTHTSCSFVIYRLPNEEKPVLMLQTSGTPSFFNHIEELNGKTGFVLAPFEITEDCPLILFQPDVIAHGNQEVSRLWQQPEIVELLQTTLVKGNEKQQPDTYDIRKQYTSAFDSFISSLHRKELEKLVLSRTLIREKEPDFSPAKTFYKACECYPSGFVYLCHTSSSGTWIGSTPEILLSGEGNEWQTVALAGTRKPNNSQTEQSWSKKNYKEQQFVSDYIREQFQQYGITCTEGKPHTIYAGKIAHLQSDFKFQLDNNDKLGTLLQLLHPTPAICGFPKQEARLFILRYEGYNRRYYSGFIGWLDPAGKSDLYVNLRCLEVNEQTIILYAGGGILPSSELTSEWQETEDKLQTMLSVIK